jgi:hypothetical protein
MLTGILGTIDALWIAFRSVDVLDTAKKQATLAQGIATSLNPTAIGLVAAMGLLAGYYLLRGLAVSLTERLHHGVTVVTNLLAPPDMVAYAPVALGEATAANSKNSSMNMASGGDDFAPSSDASSSSGVGLASSSLTRTGSAIKTTSGAGDASPTWRSSSRNTSAIRAATDLSSAPLPAVISDRTVTWRSQRASNSSFVWKAASE